MKRPDLEDVLKTGNGFFSDVKGLLRNTVVQIPA
jgi:hypothetical protein